MEPVRPPSGPSAPQAVAKVTPLGRGWMLVALEAGFALRNASQGLDLRLPPEDAEAVRRGELRPEDIAARAAPAQHPPPGAVTVAFSAEAMRLSGRMDAGKTGSKTGAGKAGAEKGRSGPPQVVAVPPLVWIGAGCLALLVLVLIGTG